MDSKLKIDNTLVGETIAGSREAYGELYSRHKNRVLTMLNTKCKGDQALAKDLMQETFIKAFVNIHQFDSQYNFGQWISAIARNLFIDHTRRNPDRDTELNAIDTPSNLPSPEQKFINKQNDTELKVAIEKLPKHYRTIFVLRYLDDLSYEEISVELSMPMGTVKTQIHRARERFLRELGLISFD